MNYERILWQSNHEKVDTTKVKHEKNNFDLFIPITNP